MNKGGRYIIDGDETPVHEPGTKDHPEGNRPRDAKGKPLDVPKAQAKAASPAKTKAPAAAGKAK